MRFFTVRAFAETEEQGNAAGVVLPDPDERIRAGKMQETARKTGFSETAFISKLNEDEFSVRFFTPTEEIAMCGHASIASAIVLRRTGLLKKDSCVFHTMHEDVDILLENPVVWLKFGKPRILYELPDDIVNELCAAYGLKLSDLCPGMYPAVVNAGIPDIQFPVSSRKALLDAVQDTDAVTYITGRLDVVGVHMFYVPEKQPVRAYCSNFAPRFGIDEECATGTANAGLTYYLYKKNIIHSDESNCILQGEHMGVPSKIYSRIIQDRDGISVMIGGTGVICRSETI